MNYTVPTSPLFSSLNLKPIINPHHTKPTTLLRYARALSLPSASPSLVAEKMNTLVSEFRALPQPIDRVKRLLHYAAKLPECSELVKEARTRVDGCTTQVWMEAEMDEMGRMRFKADSDSEISKGFCSCLIWMFDGAEAREVLEIEGKDLEDVNVGLYGNANSRVNTWLNVLVAMQRKTREELLKKNKKMKTPFASEATRTAAKGMETELERKLKDEIDGLKKELESMNNVNPGTVQQSSVTQPSLHDIVAQKERELELLIRDLDEKVRFGQKAIDRPGSGAGRPGSSAGRPGSGAGRAGSFLDRTPSQSGSFEDPRNMEYIDRPQSHGKGDGWGRPSDDRRGFQGNRERGFHGNRDGGYQGNGDGGFQGSRDGGFQGNREGGFRGSREGGFLGNRDFPRFLIYCRELERGETCHSLTPGSSGIQARVESNAIKLAEQDESILIYSGIPYTIIRAVWLQNSLGGMDLRALALKRSNSRERW